jgi:CheY-like chemotaxis protein
MLDRIQAGADRIMPVHEDQACIVRFVFDGKACAFMSKVVDWNSRREAGWVRITWPDDMEVKSFRKHDRVKANLPCTLSKDGQKSGDGEILDISLGGCAIQTSEELHFGNQVAMTFFMPNGVRIQDAEIVVRKARKVGDRRWLLGGEFCEGQEYLQNEVAAFVASSLRPDRTKLDKALRCVLILDGNAATREALCSGLSQSGRESVSAANAIEGFHRLFAAMPSALVVSQELADLSGIEVVRVLKVNPTFEALPILLYGGNDPSLGERALQAGAARYLAPSASMVVDVCNAIAALDAP